MEVIGAIASFIAIGQAIGATPKIISTLKSFTNASKELATLIDELERLYVLYQHLKENVDLFSGDHNQSLLRINEPPYLKLIRTDLECLINELQELADSCLNNGGSGPKVSKLRWWRKRGDVARLRDACHKQRDQLLHLYMLFKDQLTHKHGEILVHIQTSISQRDGHPPHESGSLLSLSEIDPPTRLESSTQGAIVSQSHIALLNPVTAAEEVIGRRCHCFCHDSKASKRNNYGRHIPLLGSGLLTYQSQTVTGSKCRINCCAATQSFVSIQLRMPTWFRSLAFTGSLRFGFPFNLYTSLTPMTLYSSKYDLQLQRVCYLERPDYFNQWLSYYVRSILSVDENGLGVLRSIVFCGGYSLLTHCIATWPTLITGTTQAREAADLARNELHQANRLGLSASDKFHLTRFMQFVDDEDRTDPIDDIICSENPIQMLEQVLSDTPDILTKRSIRDNTILHQACRVDNVELVKHLLSIGALVEMANVEGDTPLHVAILNGAWSSAELLVNKGCQVNVKKKLGETPLMLALYEIGNDTNEAIRFSKTLLSRAAGAGVETYKKRCVWHMIARLSGSQREDLWELYEMLFAAGGAHVIDLFEYSERTPLIDAVLAKDVPLISFLQKVGARCDTVSNSGWNLLHWVGDLGDSQCCQLVEDLEISCIDIRTTDNDEFTPLESFRRVINGYCGASDFSRRSEWGLSWRNMDQDNPGEEIVSPEKSTAFGHLLRSIRDRMLVQEIKELDVTISKIHALDLSSARDMLKRVAEGKVKAKIYHEAETFRAIDLDVRESRLELAVESIKEFIEASRDRMLVSPFEEEVNPYDSSSSDSEGSDGLSEDDGESTAEIETDDEDGAD